MESHVWYINTMESGWLIFGDKLFISHCFVSNFIVHHLFLLDSVTSWYIITIVFIITVLSSSSLLLLLLLLLVLVGLFQLFSCSYLNPWDLPFFSYSSLHGGMWEIISSSMVLNYQLELNHGTTSFPVWSWVIAVLLLLVDFIQLWYFWSIAA